MNKFLDQLRGSMIELGLGISGALNVTEAMETLAHDLQANRVNALWREKAYPSLKPLAVWFSDLLDRVNQLVAWTTDLVLLRSVWISGLFNAMAFFTSNMQVAARANSLPLDFMTNRFTFTNIRDVNELAGYPARGVYVHGLFLEGAGWEDGKGDEEGYITESKHKELHPVMAICNAVALHIFDEMDWTAMYHCPLFSTTLRGATYVCTTNMRMDPDDVEWRWILAGAALLTQED